MDRLPLLGNHANFEATGIGNLQPKDLELINSIAKNPNIIINTADKNLGFTINHIEWYEQEYQRQLSDYEIYEQLPLEQIPNILEKGREELLLIYNRYSNDSSLNSYKIAIP